jgi:hypothetical protein
MRDAAIKATVNRLIAGILFDILCCIILRTNHTNLSISDRSEFDEILKKGLLII